MAELLIEIYIKKNIKYCSGCLHTEDVTKLSNMQTFGWVFTDLFTTLFLTDELHSSFICSWCVKRLDNAQKLLQNFQRAQILLAKISDSLFQSNNTPEIKEELSSHINDIRIKSRLNFEQQLKGSITVNTSYPRKYKLGIKTEDIDNSDSEDSEASFDNNLEVNVIEKHMFSLRSRNVKIDNYIIEKKKQVDKKSSEESQAKVKKENCKLTVLTKDTKRDINLSEKVSDRQKSTDNNKFVSNILKEVRELKEEIGSKEFTNCYKNISHDLNLEKNISDPDQVPLSCIKSLMKVEKTDLDIDVNNTSKSNPIPGKHRTKRTRRYLRHLPRIPCKECDRRFIKEIALENHMTHNHKRKYPCEQCNKVFTKEECLKIHIAKVHEPKNGTFECATCGKVYKHRVKIVEHIFRHQKYGPSLKDLHSIVCHHCGKICSRKSIKTHLLTHSDIKPYNCTVCNTYYKGALALENHIKRNHNPDIGKQFSCPHCPKKFYLSSDVRCHVHAVHFLKNQKCLVCSKMFRTVSKLREHVLRVHEKVPAIRNKQCEFCDKAFSTNRQLKHHRYTHTGEKPYKCDFCTSAYNQKHCLIMHKLRAHNIEKPTKIVAGNNDVKENHETIVKNHKTQEFSDNVGNWYTMAHNP